MRETFNFAFQCKSGGTHVPKEFLKTDEQRQRVQQLDDEDAFPRCIEQMLGLDGVANTFVGNNEIRGVSGGQRRRVTTGEMFQGSFPIFCADELSTGLDSSSTFSICNTLMHFTQVQSRVRVLSLLQPSPETVSLFDEIVLLSEGKVLFSGPVGEVEKTTLLGWDIKRPITWILLISYKWFQLLMERRSTSLPRRLHRRLHTPLMSSRKPLK